MTLAKICGLTTPETLDAALDGGAACRLLFTDGLDTLADQPITFNGAKPVAIVSAMVADHEALRQACAGALVDLQTTTIPDAVAQIFNPPPRVAGIVGTGVADVQGIGRPAAGRVTILGRLTAPEAQTNPLSVPCVRSLVVNARVSMPARPGTPARCRATASDSAARQLLGSL